LDELLHLGKGRGFVEIGAGNGQWARALTDAYKASEHAKEMKTKKIRFDFVLAYDDMSGLPLDPDVYHPRTKPFTAYFYDKVQPCDSISRILTQWTCRGRVLLLVFPSPGSDMAIQALQAYESISPMNDTVVYVGEGKGGANANDAFFDHLESSGNWILYKILPVKSFGAKGYEKLYVLKRKPNGTARTGT